MGKNGLASQSAITCSKLIIETVEQGVKYIQTFQSTLTIATGLSDFHKLIVTVLKVKHEKVPSKVIHYRDYKTFDWSKFFEKLQLKLSNFDMSSLDFGSLKISFMELLNKITPLKTKFLRANHSKFVTKEVVRLLC